MKEFRFRVPTREEQVIRADVADDAGFWTWVDKVTKERIEMDNTDFGWAIRQLKAGKKVGRKGWNGKGMWLMLVKADEWDMPYREATFGMLKLPWIGMKTANGEFVPWLASQTDMLADDWEVVA